MHFLFIWTKQIVVSIHIPPTSKWNATQPEKWDNTKDVENAKRGKEKGPKQAFMKLNEPGLDFLKPPLPFKAVSVLSLLRTPSSSIEDKSEQDPILEMKKGKTWRREKWDWSKKGGVNAETLIRKRKKRI